MEKLIQLRDLRRQVKQRQLDRHRSYLSDPVGWVRDELHEFLWSKQCEILESVRDHRLTTVRSCHGAGKTRTVSRAVAWWVATHPPDETRVITTAPTFNQVRAVLWQEIRNAAKKTGLPAPKQTEWQIDEVIVAQGRKPADYDPDSLQGGHAKYLLVVLDEANGVAPALWNAALSLTSGEHNRMIVIGNPDDPSSKFAEVCKPGSGWHHIQIGYRDTPNFSGEQVPRDVAEQLIGELWLDDARRMYGEGTPVWTSKVDGEFPDEAEDALIRLSKAREAAYRELQASDYPHVLGVDVARKGSDKTVVTERLGQVYRIVGEYRNKDTMQVAGLVKLHMEETGATTASIDADGLGAGVFDRLVELGVPVAEMRGGFKAQDDKHFANRRAEWYWGVRQMFESGDIDIPDDEELLAQLTALKWKTNSRGQIVIESKEDMRARGVPSPDKADSLVYASAAPSMSWTDVYGGLSAESTSSVPVERKNPWAAAYGEVKR